MAEFDTNVNNVQVLIVRSFHRHIIVLFSFVGDILKGITSVATENDVAVTCMLLTVFKL